MIPCRIWWRVSPGTQNFGGQTLEDVGSADMEQNRMSSEKGLMKRIYFAKAFGMQWVVPGITWGGETILDKFIEILKSCSTTGCESLGLAFGRVQWPSMTEAWSWIGRSQRRLAWVCGFWWGKWMKKQGKYTNEPESIWWKSDKLYIWSIEKTTKPATFFGLRIHK